MTKAERIQAIDNIIYKLNGHHDVLLAAAIGAAIGVDRKVVSDIVVKNQMIDLASLISTNKEVIKIEVPAGN